MATKQISFETHTDDIGGAYGAAWKAMSFTTVGAFTITSVKMWGFKIGVPGNLTVSIRATDVDGKPTGADLCSGTFAGGDLTADSGGQLFEITLGAGAELSATTKYAIVMRCLTGDIDNKVEFLGDLDNTYADGATISSTDSGSTWTVGAFEYYFETWGTANYSLSVDVGTFTLTGITTAITSARSMIASVGNFVLTGIDNVLTYTLAKWHYKSKNTTSWENKTKNITNWSNKTKNTTSWDAKTKNTTSWVNKSKNTTNWSFKTKN